MDIIFMLSMYARRAEALLRKSGALLRNINAQFCLIPSNNNEVLSIHKAFILFFIVRP